MLLLLANRLCILVIILHCGTRGYQITIYSFLFMVLTQKRRHASQNLIKTCVHRRLAECVNFLDHLPLTCLYACYTDCQLLCFVLQVVYYPTSGRDRVPYDPEGVLGSINSCIIVFLGTQVVWKISCIIFLCNL